MRSMQRLRCIDHQAETRRGPAQMQCGQGLPPREAPRGRHAHRALPACWGRMIHPFYRFPYTPGISSLSTLIFIIYILITHSERLFPRRKGRSSGRPRRARARDLKGIPSQDGVSANRLHGFGRAILQNFRRAVYRAGGAPPSVKYGQGLLDTDGEFSRLAKARLVL